MSLPLVLPGPHRRRAPPRTRHRCAASPASPAPYRAAIAVFLALMVVDALAGAATPLCTGRSSTRASSRIAPASSSPSLVSSPRSPSSRRSIGLAQRWFSARIGEGLINDLRTQVFDHVQRMPIGFFSRAQTGALVSRLNSDVQGAQQAFTSTLSNVVGNVVAVVATLAAMFVLSWQITLLALALLPLFVLPARWVGRRLADITRERYRLNGEMGQMMTERFNVSGRPARQAVRPPGVRVRRLRRPGRTGPRHRRHLGDVLPRGDDRARPAGLPRNGARLRARRRHGDRRLARHRHARRPDRLPRPAVRAAHRAVQRASRRHDDARQLRARARGARPRADDRRRRRHRRRCPTGRSPSSSTTSASATRPPPRCPWPRSRASPTWRTGHPTRSSAASRCASSPAARSPSSGRPAPASRRSPGSCRGCTTRPTAPCASPESTSATRRLAAVRDTVGVVAQDVHLFHDTLAANLRYAKPDATDDELVAALRAAEVWDVVARMPDGLDTVVGDRGHRLSGGEKQRIAIARLLLKDPGVVVLDEATAHLDAASEAAVQSALTGAWPVGRRS